MPDRVANRLGAALKADPGKWTLTFVGEEEMRIFSDLLDKLKDKEPKIVSGLSYWGITPTNDWQNASNDNLYRVMKWGTRTFRRRLGELGINLEANTPYHLVSLGVGTGEKDVQFLKWMQQEVGRDQWTEVGYFPVDISPEMLRLGVREVLSEAHLISYSTVLPMQLDFSRPDSLESLQNVLSSIVDDEPIIYSLLGNTLSNFDDDESLLRRLAKLLRPQDHLLLEVATTDHSNTHTADEGADEYGKINSFREFILSSLRQYTDLSVNTDNTVIEGIVEGDRAILINCYYRNKSSDPITITLADRSKIRLGAEKNIRLLISRKYTSVGISRMVKNADLTIASQQITQFSSDEGGSANRFGMALLLLSNDGDPLK